MKCKCNFFMFDRLVSLEHPLIMEIPAEEFKETSGQLTTEYEKTVAFNGNTYVRHRSFGLVDIVDLK